MVVINKIRQKQGCLFCKKTLFLAIIFILCLVIGIKYLMLSVRNTIFMDYWRFITDLVPKTVGNTLSFSDFFANSLGQKNPLMLFLVWFDIKFLKLNVLWESYAGFLVNFLECFFLYKLVKVRAEYKIVIFIPILLFTLNLNRWEIITTQFYLSFALRIFLYIATFNLIDKHILIESVPKIKKSLIIAVILAFEILFLSQLYFPALLASIAVVGVMNFLLQRNKQKIINMLYILVGGGLGVFLYFIGNTSNSSNGGNISSLLETIKNGKIFIALFYMLSAPFFQQSLLEKISYPALTLIGVTFFVFIGFSIFLFFKRKMYREAYLPLFVILYGCFQILFIIYGRISFGIFYLTASRYTFDTSLLWIGCSWIFINEISTKKNIVFRLISVVILIIISLLLIRVNFFEMKTAKYRGAYKDAINDYILEVGYDVATGKKGVNDLSSDKIPMFQAPAELVYNGINLLFKHNLNVFSNKKQEIIVLGLNSDNWIENSVKLRICPKEKQALILCFYNPSSDISGETVDFYINGTLVSSTPVQSGKWTVEVPLSQTEYGICNVEIKTDYLQKITNGDIRPLSLILSEIKLE